MLRGGKAEATYWLGNVSSNAPGRPSYGSPYYALMYRFQRSWNGQARQPTESILCKPAIVQPGNVGSCAVRVEEGVAVEVNGEPAVAEGADQKSGVVRRCRSRGTPPTIGGIVTANRALRRGESGDIHPFERCTHGDGTHPLSVERGDIRKHRMVAGDILIV